MTPLLDVLDPNGPLIAAVIAAAASPVDDRRFPPAIVAPRSRSKSPVLALAGTLRGVLASTGVASDPCSLLGAVREPMLPLGCADVVTGVEGRVWAARDSGVTVGGWVGRGADAESFLEGTTGVPPRNVHMPCFAPHMVQ